MSFYFLLLLFAGVSNVLMPLPQTIRAFRVSVAGISDTTFIVAGSIAIIWGIHGYSVKNTMMVISSIALVILTTIGVYALVKGTKNNMIWFKYFATMMSFLFIYSIPGTVTKMLLLIFVGFYMRIPQLRKVMIEDNVSGISVATWVISLVTNISWIIVAVIEKDSLLLATCFVSISLSSLIIVKVLMKRRTPKEAFAVVAS